MLEGFAQSGSNAYNMPAKELRPPFSGKKKMFRKAQGQFIQEAWHAWHGGPVKLLGAMKTLSFFKNKKKKSAYNSPWIQSIKCNFQYCNGGRGPLNRQGGSEEME